MMDNDVLCWEAVQGWEAESERERHLGRSRLRKGRGSGSDTLYHLLYPLEGIEGEYSYRLRNDEQPHPGPQSMPVSCG